MSILRVEYKTSSVIRALIVIGLMLCFRAAWAFAQEPAAEPTLEGFYQAVATENYVEAKRQADLLLPQSPPAQKFRISLAYGRVLLGLQQKEDARQYLKLMGKQELPDDGPRLLTVYEAWLVALDGKPDDAIKSLEGILEKNVHSLATAEAADVLAMLYLAKQDRTKAQQAVDFGLKFIGYAMLKTDYTEALLRSRMGSTINSPDAEKLYVAAEKLRQELKFIEAGKLYNQVCLQHGTTEWVHPAQFRIGQCLLGVNRTKQALEHWKHFIGTQTTGPWRGQARVAVIDLVLELDGDMKTASEHSLAAATTLGQTLDKEAEASWKEAAFDIQIRHGIIALVDSRYDAALTSLKQAQAHAPSDARLIAGLGRLIEAADKRTPLLPAEVRTGDEKTVMALSFGTVFNMLRQFEVSRRLFYVPLAAKGKSGSPPHRSFAAFGLARAIAGLAPSVVSDVASGGKTNGSSPPTFAQAKSLYQQSLKEFANGTWHDETLRDLALLIERMADDKFIQVPRAEAVAAAQDKTPGAKPPVRPTDAQRFEQAQQLAAARSEALVSWALIPKQFPSSRHIPQAYYHAGVLLSEGEKPVEALATFSELVKRYPDSPWTGDAQVWLIDVKLEQQFDLPGAASLATAAIGWYEKVDPAAVAKARQGYAEDEAQGLRTLQQVKYEVYLRTALVEYLRGEFDLADQYIAIAGPRPPSEGFSSDADLESIGLHYLLKAIRSKKSVTEPRALAAATVDPQRLAVQLGDLYLETIRPDKAEDVFLRIIRHDPRLDKVPPDIEGYAMLQLATSLDRQLDRRAEALEWLTVLANRRDLQGTHWGGYGCFRLALFTYNQTQDPRQSVPLYEQLLRHYPDHEITELAHLYYCLDLISLKDRRSVQNVSQSFMEKYPNSEYVGLLQKRSASFLKQSN